MGNKFYNGLGKVFLSGHNTGGHEEKQIWVHANLRGKLALIGKKGGRTRKNSQKK